MQPEPDEIRNNKTGTGALTESQGEAKVCGASRCRFLPPSPVPSREAAHIDNQGPKGPYSNVVPALRTSGS